MAEMTADELRASFLDYFRERGHTVVPSASLIPNHPAAPLFTNAGMVQFLPIFLGEEEAPYPRATSSQKVLRVRGKHDDIENVGRTTRHLTFFEMLGNFSFGDYFKDGAIQYAWDYLTNVLGLDGGRLWITVHESDDDADRLWQELVGVPPERIQRMGEDNFWEMGSTGPCGPCSEVFYDKGPEHGAEGGPLHGGEERYVEIWNLVFMQYNRAEEGGELEPLPKQNIDTGAGLERILPILQGHDSVFDTDVLRRLIGTGEELTGAAYGADEESDVSLRILADHSRAATFLIADGVVPSNEERGYVLRRIIRRAVRHAQRIGARDPVMPAMAAAVADVMSAGYPELGERLDSIAQTLEREEHRFVETLSLGLGMLEDELAKGAKEIPGETAFKLHDTYGFPIDLTAEIAQERGFELDTAGFEAAMTRQREQARGAAKGPAEGSGDAARLSSLAQEAGPTEFVGYDTTESDATVVGVEPGSDGAVEVYTDRTPFYAESGGQIGDTGTIVGDSARGRVLDTDRPVAGLIRHLVEMDEGAFEPGQSVRLEVDADRRDAIRRSHTATHLLHWALRQVAGEQLHQQGSLVAPDYLRFDFNHHSPLTEEELAEVERLVVEETLRDGAVSAEETTLAEAQRAGAMAFFGEKYGDVVRMVRAGDHSLELCGGTHVGALGQIGPVMVQSEGSVGSNLRRIEAVTGRAAHDETRRQRELVRASAAQLGVPPEELPDAVSRVSVARSDEERERRRLEAIVDRQTTGELAASAVDGVVVGRLDGRNQDALRQLALSLRDRPDVRAVGLVGAPDESSVAIAVAVDGDGDGPDAPSVVRQTAKEVGGGGGGKDPKLAVGGGRDPSRIDDALRVLRKALAAPGGD